MVALAIAQLIPLIRLRSTGLPLHVLSQLSSLMDRNEGNNACLLHLNRCKQDTPVSKNRTEFSQLQLPANTRSAALQKGQGRQMKNEYICFMPADDDN
ncbi:hypothetical protein T05_4237 [Trichinella murrelli]|uniref:Uncharacterized protein n=1 Tax=Trichinella murrelli TaxID=144512 RepID=A0A0V0UDZ7_9BILA|nr:hypothetical protein T05_4237 [Trichinella murrelli]